MLDSSGTGLKHRLLVNKIVHILVKKPMNRYALGKNAQLKRKAISKFTLAEIISFILLVTRMS